MGVRSIVVGLLGLALVRCGPSPGDGSGSTSAGDAGGTSSTSALPTTGVVTTNGSTTDDVTGAGTGTTAATLNTTTLATTGSSTGGPSECGPPCEHTWESHGWIELDETADLSQFACMTKAWDLKFTGDIPQESLAAFANLREVALDLEFVDMPGLTDLSAFGCLRESHALILTDTPALTDLSGLGELVSLLEFTARRTGIVGLPGFAPGFGGLRYIALEDNPALTDIGGLATWTTHVDWPITVHLIDDDALTSIAPLAEVLARPDHEDIRVTLIGLDSLTSRTGLEPMADPAQIAYELHLGDLPQIADLQPISAISSVVALTLAGMPKIDSLADLGDLETATYFRIGDCMDDSTMEGGMDDLTSLAGLDSLVDTYRLRVAGNANLSSLSGAPKLHELAEFAAADNPLLTPVAIDEFVAKFASPPEPVLCSNEY